MLILDERPPDGTLGSCRTNIRPEPTSRTRYHRSPLGLPYINRSRGIPIPPAPFGVKPAGEIPAILIMKSGCSYSPHEVPFSALYRRPDLDKNSKPPANGRQTEVVPLVQTVWRLG